jgi:hypothetical protein
MVGIAKVPLQHTDLVSMDRVELMGVSNSDLDMDDNEGGDERREEHNYSMLSMKSSCVYGTCKGLGRS